jgi:putative copper resistance protein D
MLLLAKATGFAGLLALAASNRFRLTPMIAAGVAQAAMLMRRTVLIELALMLLVFAATAFMTTLFSPT